jgi:UPF0288 family protein (methanogenesis marker protein 3)
LNSKKINWTASEKYCFGPMRRVNLEKVHENVTANMTQVELVEL